MELTFDSKRQASRMLSPREACAHLIQPPIRGIFASVITFFHLAMSPLM